MDPHFQHIIRTLGKGDTRMVARFIERPGGRKYLENIILILINTLPAHYDRQEELYRGFIAVLDQMEQRIKRQKEGAEILEGVLGSN